MLGPAQSECVKGQLGTALVEGVAEGSEQSGTELEHGVLSSLAPGSLTDCFPPVQGQEMAGAKRERQGFLQLDGFLSGFLSPAMGSG